MKKRTIKELLEIMLDNKDYFETGLCFWATKLYSVCLINAREFQLLNDYIKNNRPSLPLSYFCFDELIHLCSRSEYYWTKGKIKPRIKWIKKHIKKNS